MTASLLQAKQQMLLYLVLHIYHMKDGCKARELSLSTWFKQGVASLTLFCLIIFVYIQSWNTLHMIIMAGRDTIDIKKNFGPEYLISPPARIAMAFRV